MMPRVRTNQTEILEQITLFYARLYENRQIDPNDISEWDWNSISHKQHKHSDTCIYLLLYKLDVLKSGI